MLRGELTGLRARVPDDVKILDELHDDVEEWVRTSALPWVPRSPAASTFVVTDPEDRRVPADASAQFSIVELASGELAGACALWGVDAHNRSAHVGIQLLRRARGRGLGA